MEKWHICTEDWSQTYSKCSIERKTAHSHGNLEQKTIIKAFLDIKSSQNDKEGEV